MELHIIPIEDKYIIYRPLRRLAFIGNRAMADLAEKLAVADNPKTVVVPANVQTFLAQVGFYKPDLAEPPMPTRDFQPTTAVLLMTNRCNLRCTYCYASAGERPAADLTLDLAKIAIDQVYKNAVEQKRPQFEVSFHGGGEPTQAWSVMKAATEYARSKDSPAQISVVSNGVWSPQQRDWILENLDHLTISIDGAPPTQDDQRPLASGEPSSPLVMQTLAALDAAKFDYAIRLTATSPWGDHLANDVRFLVENTGCQYLQVEPAFNIKRGEHQIPDTAESAAYVAGFMEGFKIALEAGRNLSYSGIRLGMVTRQFCTAPYQAFIVNANGQLVTCYEIAGDDHQLSAMSTIGQVTGSEVALHDAARDTLLDYIENKQVSQCVGCHSRWHCAGDCYARASAVEDGTLQAIQPRCAINRELTTQMLLWLMMQNNGVWYGQFQQTPFCQ